jgi:hypothetical protein
MNDITIGPDQAEEEALACEVSDEALETAAGTGKEMASWTIPPIWCPDS